MNFTIKTLGTLVLASIGTLAGCASATDSTTAEAALSQGKPADREGRHAHMHGRMNHNPEKMFAHLDKNGNGKLELAEMPEHMREHMARADLDKDGALTKDEMKQAFEAQRKAHMAQMDTDGDGKISDAEREAAHKKFMTARFQKEDKNSDGALTADEVGEKHWAFLKNADANNDGKVTQDEISAAFKSGALKPPMHGPGMHDKQ